MQFDEVLLCVGRLGVVLMGGFANFVAGPEDIKGQPRQGVEVAKFKRERTADTEQPLAQYHLEPQFTAEHYARQPRELRDPPIFLIASPVPFRTSAEAHELEKEKSCVMYWQLTFLTCWMQVPPFLVRKLFTQIFSFINVQLFNR